MPTHIGLSDERAEQLKKLAKKLGVSSAEAIGFMLNRAMDDNLIPREIHGFDIRAVGGEVVFDIIDADAERKGMVVALATMATPYIGGLQPTEALEIADKLEQVTANYHYRPAYEPMARYNVNRQGTGVRIKIFGGSSRIVTKDIARSLADMIRLAAKEASQAPVTA